MEDQINDITFTFKEFTLEDILNIKLSIDEQETKSKTLIQLQKIIQEKIIDYMIKHNKLTIHDSELKKIFHSERDLYCYIIGFISGLIYSRLIYFC